MYNAAFNVSRRLGLYIPSSIVKRRFIANSDLPISNRSIRPCSLHGDILDSDPVPFRKRLKDQHKKDRQSQVNGHERSVLKNSPNLNAWRLTIGLEIHAQLNTQHKLFSYARTNSSDQPNTNLALFDLALPGSQPCFQRATLIPALRAALSLNCDIENESYFDRKHYYYQDPPAGYQITQYYRPFASNGQIFLLDHEGIADKDGKSVRIGIQQVQLEQDTAKSTVQPPSTALLDFNRVGHPLIEIITLPQIHHPETAAACVKKIQAILQRVGAVTAGMEQGGMRVDVIVSVSPTSSSSLGQRTEIKNLNSIRQISVLTSGGIVDGETRRWSLGSTETRSLRGKEGQVDYRYMPDPDIMPLFIGKVSVGSGRTLVLFALTK